MRRTPTTNRELQQVQQNVHDALAPMEASRIVRGALLEGIELTTGATNIVQHQLGRPIKGCVVVMQSANSTVWTDQSGNTEPIKYVHLQCSANVTVSVWVF